MKKNYDLNFYDLVARCFTHLDERYGGTDFVIATKEIILRLWDNDSLVIEGVPVKQEVVRERLLDRLDADKLDEFIAERFESGWSSDPDVNAEELYWLLMTVDEYGEIFEDDRYYDVILED